MFKSSKINLKVCIFKVFVLLGVGGYYAYKFFKPDEPVQVVPVEKVTQEGQKLGRLRFFDHNC